jgi:hypothetical protein
MPESPPPRVEFVTHRVLNTAYEAMVAHYRKRKIELLSTIVYAKPAGAAYNQPLGTTSILEVLSDPDTGRAVAYVHYYLLADGKTIGASGKKDPKRVIFEGVDYRVRPRSARADG